MAAKLEDLGSFNLGGRTMSNSQRSSENEAFWRLVLEEYQGSGLTIRAFCRQESLSEPSFYAWRKSIRKRDAEEPNESRNPQALIPVDVVAASDASPRGDEPSPPLEVVTPSGFTLRFHHDIDLHQLSALLGVIAHSRRTVPC